MSMTDQPQVLQTDSLQQRLTQLVGFLQSAFQEEPWSTPSNADSGRGCCRLWKRAELLFGQGQRATAWARKMQKWLLKPGGVNRVLHSAAALRNLYALRGTKLKEFRTAYRYLRDRMRYMAYALYRRLGLPVGSGVTEAACKTVYTQRLKLSGMRWQKSGAQRILNLRVLQLSGVWEAAYARARDGFTPVEVRGQSESHGKRLRQAG